MRPTRSARRWQIVLATLALLMVSERRGSSTQSAAAAPQATCVFTNPAFAGKCTETTAVARGSTPQKSCEAILQCLNDVGCLRTFCQSTTVRTGWKLASAK